MDYKLKEDSQKIYAMINDLELTNWEDVRRDRVSDIEGLYQLVVDLDEENGAISGLQEACRIAFEENEKLKAELLQTKFDAWREVQQETNPQYTIDEEIGCLLRESDDTELIKKIFDELYAGQYEYVIETETYRECEEESDEE